MCRTLMVLGALARMRSLVGVWGLRDLFLRMGHGLGGRG